MASDLMNQDTANAIAASVAALTSALRAERDALRAEVDRLHKKLDALAENFAQCRKGYDEHRQRAETLAGYNRRLLRAAQSLHRAWRRERATAPRLRTFVAALRVEQAKAEGQAVIELPRMDGEDMMPLTPEDSDA